MPFAFIKERGNPAPMTKPPADKKPLADTPLTRAIVAYMAKTGVSARALSLRVGDNDTLVKKILAGESKNPRSDTVAKLCAEMGIQPASVMPDAAADPPEPNGRPAPDVEIPGRRDMPRDLPVFGTARGANGDGAMVISRGDVIDYWRRPPGLVGNRKAYGIYVEGDSMEPAFRHGDFIIVDEGRKIRPGDRIVLVEVRAEGEEFAYVKEMVRTTPDKVVVRQFNPPKEIEFRLDRVRMGRILTLAEMFGV